jgi:hypothetical protein
MNGGTNPTKPALYARDLKRKYEDKDLSTRRRMEDSGFKEGTPNMERAVKMMHKAGNSYPPDIPKLVSLKDAKESTPGGSKPFPNYDFKQAKQKDFSKMQFLDDEGMKKGGKVKKMASGGMTASASKRGDGIAQRGKTRGKMC